MKAHEDKQNFCFCYLSISTTHLEPTLWVTWGPRKPRTCGLANRYAYSTWGKYVVFRYRYWNSSQTCACCYTKCNSIYVPSFSTIRWLCVCESTGFPPVWCLTIHLLYVQAASDCSLPATEGNHLHLEHLVWRDDLTSMKTKICLSDFLYWSCLPSDKYHLKFRPANSSTS